MSEMCTISMYHLIILSICFGGGSSLQCHPQKWALEKNNIVIVFERFHIDYLLRGMIYYITCVSINALILLLVFSDHIIGLRSQSASSSRLASRV